MIDRANIRALAAEHIRELGLSAPPFDHQASLRARRLTLLDDPLQAILADSNLPEEARDKIDGFIDIQERVICLKGGLHPHQHRFGLRHEVAHEVIPWQREMLHYCPFLSLPLELQHEFEREANLFAAECAFFADRFVELVRSYPADLRSVILLADEHVASYEATVRHYVECYPARCLLLISRLLPADDVGADTFETIQYIRSGEAKLAVRPRQRFDATPLLNLVVNSGDRLVVIDHELELAGQYSLHRHRAQSFWNGYKLFTLVWL